MKRLARFGLAWLVLASPVLANEYRPPGGGGISSGSTTITGGADTQVCFNDAGSLSCGDAGATYNKTTDTLTTTLSGNASTATALAANGANCSAGQFPLGVNASGAAESCSTSISGNSATATALAANGANCSAGQFPLGIDASGAAESCSSALTGNADTASALASNPSDCSANQFATTIAANGNLTCQVITLGTDTSGSYALGSAEAGALAVSLPNSSSTGTTTNKLVKVNSSGQGVITSTSDTDDAIGICRSGCGTTGSAVVEVAGTVTCDFDSTATAGNYAGIDDSTAGDCKDVGATTPTTGISVIGRVITGGVGAGNYTINLSTPDVASAGTAGGGSKNPAGAAGDVQYRGASNNFAAEAAFNYTAASNLLAVGSTAPQVLIRGAAPAGDGTTSLLAATGTLPTAPSAPVQGLAYNITSAGSTAQDQYGEVNNFLAGYTGSARTVGFYTKNIAAGTGNTLSLQSDLDAVGNIGGVFNAGTTTTGLNVALSARVDGSTGTNIANYARALDTAAGNNIAILGSAANSTEATDLKNVGVYGTLSSGLITGVNGSFAGLFDGGTLPDATSNVLQARGTLPSSPSTTTIGTDFSITSAGSASQIQIGSRFLLNSGYTGSSDTRAISINNAASGTGATLGLNSSGGFAGNQGARLATTGTGAGTFVGGVFEPTGAGTGINIGGYGKANPAAAGTNIGILGNASSSTEGTDFINVGGYFTTRNALTTGVNASVALIAENGSTEDIFRAYDAGTLVFQITDGGGIKTTGAATGQSVTASVRDAGGVADCNLVFTNGLLTSTTC